MVPEFTVKDSVTKIIEGRIYKAVEAGWTWGRSHKGGSLKTIQRPNIYIQIIWFIDILLYILIDFLHTNLRHRRVEPCGTHLWNHLHQVSGNATEKVWMWGEGSAMQCWGSQCFATVPTAALRSDHLWWFGRKRIGWFEFLLCCEYLPFRYYKCDEKG